MGSLVGAVIGFGIKHIKDSTNLTTILRDKDRCLGLCAPTIKPLLSGIWMDENEDLYEIDFEQLEGSIPAVHLSNVVRDDIYPGWREVHRISN